jgi:hypothetical protein
MSDDRFQVICELPSISSTVVPYHDVAAALLRHGRTSFSGTPLLLLPLLTVYICVKVQVDLQADKSPVVAKGPFFPRVVNPRYRICGQCVMQDPI